MGKYKDVKKVSIDKTKTISELQAIWNVEKDIFKEKELGGLQNFIRDIFLSKELFALKEGRESTEKQKRKNEFTQETHKEGSRGRADFVIFIDGDDVVIPVEVERLGNIKAGESQILQYQTDWRKKYGILTDGNEWRFYFDRVYDRFKLDDIFDKKSDFWKKWKLYISPETYYNMTFNPKGQQELFETDRLDPCTAENRPFFFNDITTLLGTFKDKITDIVPLFKREQRTAIETTYSYIIQFILYKVIIDNNSSKLKNDYNTFREWVQKALQEGDYSRVIKDIKNISEYVYKKVYEPFRSKQEDINKRLIEQLKKSPTLNDIAPWLDIIMFIDRYDFADIRNELFGFVYENYLKELYHDENKGQYFTDPAVVNFMLEELGYTAENLKTHPDKISIIDPSCGAGTFLYSATTQIKDAFNKNTEASSKYIEELIHNNVFGMDIEEFPLFLAEMNILMQLLPIVVNANYNNPINEKLKLFITKDSIAEFLNSYINPNFKNGQIENGLFDDFNYNNTPTYMREREDLKDLFKSLKGDLNTRQRFDFVIGNPPYIGYNECSRNNLSFIKRIQDKDDNLITMGNVYGVNLNTVPGFIKPYSPKPNIYAFFIALGFALLKENGKICYIIPQTMLTSGDHDVLRYHLAKYTTIEKIITFEGNVFIGRGLKQRRPVPTSSLIFVCKKTKPSKNHSVKITNYQNYSDKRGIEIQTYIKSRKKNTKLILQSELTENVVNWNFIKSNEIELNLLTKYKSINTLSIEEYRRTALADYDEICLDGGLKLDVSKIKNKYNEDAYKVFDPKNNNYKHYKTTSSNLYYPAKAKIGFIPGGQGMKAFLNKYKIIWKTRFIEKFQLSAEDNLLLNNNQSLVISSNNKNEILFLLSLLNSNITMLILKMMLKLPNEATYIVPITAIKQYIRIPKITQNNIHVKKEIIKQTEVMLNLENLIINDIVEFPRTTIQSFDHVRVEGSRLLLCKEDKTVTGKIKRAKEKIAEKTINSEYFPKDGSLLPIKEINLEELKQLPAIDFDKQKEIKSYIDDLVFALYFNISLPELGLENYSKIHSLCSKNEYYVLVNEINS